MIKEISGADRQLLDRWPVRDYINSFSKLSPYAGYRDVPGFARAVCQNIVHTAGPDALDAYHRLVLVRLLESFTERISAIAIPESISHLTFEFAEQVKSEVENPRRGYFSQQNDRFVKDLGVCRLKLLVGGPEVIELYSGFPRRDLILPPRRDIFSRLSFIIRNIGGIRPYYETHLDRRLIREFCEEGYRKFYHRLAELLQLNPDVRGVMFGATWFVDPAISRISPELSFLRDLPVQNGARLFPTVTTKASVNDALRISAVRKRLFDEGKYQPKSFAMLWARKDLLAWSEAQRQEICRSSGT